MTRPRSDDDDVLRRLGYAPELSRRLGTFSNFALSFSIICILAGGVTSFHLGYCGVGGAAIGLGWPLGCLFALAVAMTMAQVASAFPTAGGLYHWAAILGGRGRGWAVAWLNLAGLVAVLAAIDVGALAFARGWLSSIIDGVPASPASPTVQAIGVAAIAGSQAALNHLGVRLTTRLTDASGYLILVVATALTAAMLAFAPGLDPGRLVTFAHFGGPAGGGVWPGSAGPARLFALGLLLPLYTMTGFDASAHAAEETVGAATNVPRGIVRSVLVSGLTGWAMLAAVVMAVPDPAAVAARGEGAFPFALAAVLPRGLCAALGAGIAAAMYGCGLGATMSASRMAYAFARDGGLPFSATLRRVGPRHTPAAAIWAVAAASWLFTLWTPAYATITAVCVILLYLSYVAPTALGALAHGRSWRRMGPWDLRGWYRPLAAVSVLGAAGLVAIGVQPPNGRAAVVLLGMLAALVVGWYGVGRRRFAGPPARLMDAEGAEVAEDTSVETTS
ncbi:MAG TPA: amino acid permease [Isosphaeraceae bacterium]|jgi:amino acid transporter|nr:amino acid permease [Isosphaeraceae bacterium]